MNILVTLDSGYIPPLCAMLKTLAVTNGNEKINLYVAHSSLSESDIKKIRSALMGCNARVYPIKVSASLFEGAPVMDRITKETYYRLFAPAYLPGEVDRVLYIDPDTSVINPLSAFYHTNFGDKLIIGAKHFNGVVGRWNRFRLGIKKSPHYINAGVMLLNIKEMRKSFDKNEILDLITKKKKLLFLADQDVINIYYDGKIGTASEYIINLDERCFKRKLKSMSIDSALEWVKRETAIVHFNGKNKPWKENYRGYLKCFYDIGENYGGACEKIYKNAS